MIERTRAGLAAAAANNRHGGRPRKIDDAAAVRAKELKGKGVTASDIGKMLGVSRATVYRYLIYIGTTESGPEKSGDDMHAGAGEGWPVGHHE
jgi:DNA invertase Pin-like site-specific DNA recombinase